MEQPNYGPRIRVSFTVLGPDDETERRIKHQIQTALYEGGCPVRKPEPLTPTPTRHLRSVAASGERE